MYSIPIYLDCSCSNFSMIEKFVVKIYKRPPLKRDGRVRKIVLESILCHPNINKYHACVRSDSHVYVFLDQSSQRISLAEHLAKRDRPLRDLTALKMARQIVSALTYCHTQHIVHLSLSTKKIYLELGTSTVVISGFSHCIDSQARGPSADYGQDNALDRFNADSSVKKAIAAPELRAGKKFVAFQDYFKPDVWAFGMVLWSMRFQRAPPRDGFTRQSTIISFEGE